MNALSSLGEPLFNKMVEHRCSLALMFTLIVCTTVIFLTMGSSGSLPLTKARNYKPVVIIHGVNESPSTLEFLQIFIEKSHPGTDVHRIPFLHGAESFLPLWFQVDRFRDFVKNISRASEDGIHLIGYSQGGLSARAVVSTFPDHRIDTFISLAAPQLGQYGETMLMDKLCYGGICLYDWAEKNFYQILYNAWGQLSNLGGYWRDPHHLDLFLEECKFLPILNNETYNKKSEEYKANMLQLKRLVLIGTMNDTTITPWQSSLFGFYDENENIVEMKQQEVYTKDLFGLKTLDERGDLVVLTASGLDHQDLPNDEDFLEEYVLPWLT